MKVSVISQYNVFLANEPGSLRKFSQMLHGQGLDIVGLMADMNLDADVIKLVIESLDKTEETPPISRIITQAGYISVKTDILCVEEEGRDGLIFKVSKILESAGINITGIYGSYIGASKHERIFLNVDDLEKAIRLLGAAAGRAC